MVAQVAAEEPDTAAKMPQPTMLTCIRRPGSQVTQGDRPANISSDSLVRNRISPIQTNSGRAASDQEALELQNDWNRLTSGGLLVKNCRPNQATALIAMPIHRPPASSASISPKMIAASRSALIRWTR